MLAVKTLGLHGHNRTVADYWLSLWSGDRPPLRASFDPKRLPTRLPAMTVMEVRSGESLRCALAGSYYRLMYGIEITGKDVLALTPEAQRGKRMGNVEAIVMGQVVAQLKPLRRDDGSITWIESVCLPFADPTADGARRYLTHANWQPAGMDWILPERPRFTFGLWDNHLNLPLA